MSKDIKEFNDAIDTLHSIKMERDKLKAEVENLKLRRPRMEKINQLCKELEYHIVMGLEEGDINESFVYKSTIPHPISKHATTYRQLEIRLGEISWYTAGGGGSGKW